MYPVREIKDICYDRENDLLLDLYLPETEGPCPVFVFFHGGGIEDYRQKDMGAPVSRYLAAKGILCVNPAYRHYPKAAFPDFIEDGAKAVAWTKRHIRDYADPGKLFVGGHSAGAHLAMLLCFDGHYLSACGLNSKNDVDGYLFISGQPTTHMNVLKDLSSYGLGAVADAKGWNTVFALIFLICISSVVIGSLSGSYNHTPLPCAGMLKLYDPFGIYSLYAS